LNFEKMYHFITTDVFTSVRFGGNPLAVVTDARGLDSDRMLAITREFGYSETVFVLPPDDDAHMAKLRIFTPGGELPFAGHPTVGTAIVLVETGVAELDATGRAEIVLEEGVGPIRVRLSQRDGRQFAELTAAVAPTVVTGVASREEIASALSLEAADLDPVRAPSIVSCGVPFTFAAVRNRSVLARIRLDREAFARGLASTEGPQLFVFAADPENEAHDLRARMFAPMLGVDEDPATGSACAALAGYIGSDLPDGEHRWIVEQGYEMGRPSQVHVAAVVRGTRVVAAKVGGHAVRVTEGSLDVD
jgi:trans-2,3-dihydro-3-hydroxyanthranilate isomerase